MSISIISPLLAAPPFTISESVPIIFTAGTGVFTIAGQSTTLLSKRILITQNGQFQITGTPVNLKAGRYLSANSGSFSVIGHAAIVVNGFVASASPGIFTITGQPVDTILARLFSLRPGTFVINGSSVSPIHLGSRSILIGWSVDQSSIPLVGTWHVGEDLVLVFTATLPTNIAGWTIVVTLYDNVEKNILLGPLNINIIDAVNGIFALPLTRAQTTTLGRMVRWLQVRRIDSGSNTVLAEGRVIIHM